MRYSLFILILFLSLVFAACEDDNYQLYDTGQINTIFFEKDTIRFNYGLNMDKDCDIELNLGLIGLVNTEQDIPFVVKPDGKSSTAKLNLHYTMEAQQFFMKDSVRAHIKLDLFKDELVKNVEYKLYLQLGENEYFRPTHRTRCVVIFGDISLQQPAWWLPDYLGTYNQDKLVLFVECFRQSKDKAPLIYNMIVQDYGENLDKEDYERYQWLLTTDSHRGFLDKYIYIPMYEYYQQTKDPKYQIPDPSLRGAE